MKTIAQMSRAGSVIPRPMSIPNTQNSNESSYTNNSDSLSPRWDVSAFGIDQSSEGKINPLIGMGLTDEQYSKILQNMISTEDFLQSDSAVPSAYPTMSMKRDFDGVGELGERRPEKRSRFQEVLE
jgi:hypothetical protein